MRYICFLIFVFRIILVQGQQNPDSVLYSNHVFNEKIKTVQIYKEGWNLSYPIIKLNTDEKLEFKFDLLEDQPETFYYTFIHCDKDWQKSDIFPNDYLSDNAENPVENYTNSFNTTVNYIHYDLSFPNDRISFKISGNYVLKVYPADKPDEPAITQRFIITEDAAKVNINVHRPQMTKDNNAYQQVDFTADYSGIQITDSYRSVFATILQNGRWDNHIGNLKPELTGNNQLKYNSLSNKNIFEAGNEFRYFDIKSIRYQTEFVRKIDYAVPNYNVYLVPSEEREFKPYFYWKDFNGNYYVAFQEGKKPDTESDYVYVYFTFPSAQAVQGGKVYVSGALNNWALDKNNVMTWNQEKKQYECTMLLKQGWYNYEYVFLKDREKHGSASFFEGSHYETENDYIVLIYYRNPHQRYDRVIGTAIANTLNKLSS